MYLFARTRTCAPDRMADALTYAVDIAARVSTITGHHVVAHQTLYGAPITTLSWTTTVESHAEMGTAMEKLASDPAYLEAAQAGTALFEGPAQDMLIDIVSTVGSGGHRGAYASLISAQIADGRIADAMGWGVEMLEHVCGVTGRDGVFTHAMYGPWASVGWITLADSLEEVEEATAAANADPEYIARIDAAAGYFRPDSGEGRLTHRIG